MATINDIKPKFDLIKNFSLVIIGIAFLAFIFGTIKALDIVSKTHIGTSEGTYTSYVTTSGEIQEQAKTLTQNCQSKLCQVQKLLDFSSNIPYKTSTFQKK